MSQMFSFAEKFYAARLKDKTGNNQFLPFYGVRNFLFLYLGQCSAPGLRLLVKIMLVCGKLCIDELKQGVSQCAAYFSLFGFIYGHFFFFFIQV